MDQADLISIHARKGKAVALDAGQRVRVINTLGQQVVDTWAFNRQSLSEATALELMSPRLMSPELMSPELMSPEFMSMEHTRTALGRIMAEAGDSMVTNQRRPILTLLEDTSPGIHDTLLAACDRYRYELLGCTGYHDNCTDNLAAALAELGYRALETPSPWNLFMNIPVGAGGSLSFEAPVSKPGDYVLLRAELDCVVAFSSCPQDIVPINGLACAPTEAHVQVL